MILALISKINPDVDEDEKKMSECESMASKFIAWGIRWDGRYAM